MQELDPKDRAILETAARHFAIQGFGSARMDEIAKDAKVNKATIYYRIGDKAELYEKVYSLILDTLINKINSACDPINNPEQALRTYIQTIAQQCEDNSFMSRIVLREVASQGQHLSENTLIKMHQVRMLLSKILHKGMESGQFSPVNPFMIHMLIIGFLSFYSAGKPIREKISNFDSQSKENVILQTTQAAEEITQLILNSISTSKG